MLFNIAVITTIHTHSFFGGGSTLPDVAGVADTASGESQPAFREVGLLPIINLGTVTVLPSGTISCAGIGSGFYLYTYFISHFLSDH